MILIGGTLAPSVYRLRGIGHMRSFLARRGRLGREQARRPELETASSVRSAPTARVTEPFRRQSGLVHFRAAPCPLFCPLGAIERGHRPHICPLGLRPVLLMTHGHWVDPNVGHAIAERLRVRRVRLPDQDAAILLAWADKRICSEGLP